MPHEAASSQALARTLSPCGESAQLVLPLLFVPDRVTPERWYRVR